MTKKKLPKINLDDWGTIEEGMPKVKNKISLVPTGKDGQEIEWYGRSWAGVIDYAKALGLKYTDVGSLIENTYGDRTSFKQIIFAQQVHKSLSMLDYYRRPRIKVAPTGKESDMHYAIRMDQKAIFKLYKEAGGSAKDRFKGIKKMYDNVYKNRKNFVEAYLFEDKKTEAQLKIIAEARCKALGYKGLFEKIEKDFIKNKKK